MLDSWLYRKQPSVCHEPFQPYTKNLLLEEATEVTPNQLRWDPFPIPSSKEEPCDFVDGLALVCSAGSPIEKNGLAIYMYVANGSMENRVFSTGNGQHPHHPSFIG